MKVFGSTYNIAVHGLYSIENNEHGYFVFSQYSDIRLEPAEVMA